MVAIGLRPGSRSVIELACHSVCSTRSPCRKRGADLVATRSTALSCRFLCDVEVAEIGRLMRGAFRPKNE
jgi:hypothetical protein